MLETDFSLLYYWSNNNFLATVYHTMYKNLDFKEYVGITQFWLDKYDFQAILPTPHYAVLVQYSILYKPWMFECPLSTITLKKLTFWKNPTDFEFWSRHEQRIQICRAFSGKRIGNLRKWEGTRKIVIVGPVLLPLLSVELRWTRPYAKSLFLFLWLSSDFWNLTLDTWNI